tara:strand:- start:7896 stop:8468 length:573 start_codon:yes stop_codon:yes gene_type:complete
MHLTNLRNGCEDVGTGGEEGDSDEESAADDFEVFGVHSEATSNQVLSPAVQARQWTQKVCSITRKDLDMDQYLTKEAVLNNDGHKFTSKLMNLANSAIDPHTEAAIPGQDSPHSGERTDDMEPSSAVRTLPMSCHKIEVFRQQVKKYMDGPFTPLVKEVRVFLRTKALDQNIVVVDLTGKRTLICPDYGL